MKLNICHKNNFDKRATQIALEELKGKSNTTIGFATGNTTISFHRKLAQDINEENIDCSNITTVNLDEYINVPSNNESSCYYRMYEQFFKHISLRKDQILFLNDITEQDDLEQKCIEFDKKIEKSGGIDIQFLGIGRNGHIGFNEPGTPFETMTHVSRINDESREAKIDTFGTYENVPKLGITMGIKSIMMAKKIVLLAKGSSKADIIYKSLFGPVTPDVPASVLQLHPRFEVVLDEDAAIRVKELTA